MQQTTGAEGTGVIWKATRRLTDLFILIAGIGLFLMMIHVVIDVIARAFFRVALPGTIEVVSSYYMVAAVFLPLAMVQRRHAHIMVSLFTEWMSPRAVHRLDTVVRVVFALAAIGFALVTGEVAIEKTAIQEKIVTPDGFVLIWLSRWLLPISAAALAIVLLCQAAGLAGAHGGQGDPENHNDESGA
ncbi:TRAP transporter small permease [Pseudooceanicola sp.]|jgi:TRAP-type C4-dicarboxylate transport system permease small subunit|uniref:TRAP transporter small permease n=1 Tax=Pseudooceanicola sp. TaxID=1914328 RepID=UPI0040599B87